MPIVRATIEELVEVAQLFDQYRVFYRAPSNLTAAQDFLRQRLERQDSVIFVAYWCDRMAGFTQLYPSFSSVSLGPIWILNDLFVLESCRRLGLATQLMERAETFARESGAIRIALSTQSFNHGAQSLYRSRGYKKDDEFWHYSLSF